MITNVFTGLCKSFLLVAVGKSSLSSVAQSCPTLCSPMDCSTPGLPVHHHLTLIRMATSKTYKNKFCRGRGEKGALLPCWWECKSVHPLGRTLLRFF